MKTQKQEEIANKNNGRDPSVAIISFNAQDTIERTLESVKDFNEIVIVDNGSVDRTVEIAQKFTDKIFISRANDFKKLREFALKKISNNWVFFIDADEIISEENKKKFLKLWRQYREQYDGFWLKRRNYYDKKENQYLKHGLFYPDYQLRLFRKKYQYINNPHEVPNIPSEKTYYFRDVEIFHYPNKKKLFSLFGWFNLMPIAKRHAQSLKDKNFWFLLYKAFAGFFDLFFVSLLRGKGILDGVYGVLAAFNFSVHISLIYFYAIFLKIKKSNSSGN